MKILWPQQGSRMKIGADSHQFEEFWEQAGTNPGNLGIYYEADGRMSRALRTF